MKYKVGDKVRIKSLDWYNENKGNADKTNSVWCKDGGAWFFYHMSQHCGEIMTIKNVWVNSYTLAGSDSRWTDEMIEGLVEEESEKKLSDESWRYKNIFDSSQYPQSFECPEGYIFKDENGNEILTSTSKIILEKKKKEYPKTYEECYKIMGVKLSDCYIQGYKFPLLEDLQELLICRDAYWKIAGEEMGLGKPWEPDWEGEGCYVIVNHGGDVVTDIQWHANAILAFPTEEMRDYFYENFKELIEICKELL